MHVVAVDGPAGSGKSSVSRAAAISLGFGYLDTGAAYRALTLASLNKEIDPNQLDAGTIDQSFDYEISIDPINYWVRAFGKDVTEEIRSEKVASNVSEVAKLPQVRQYMRNLTRKIVGKCEFPGIIVEGRDITTVVFPDAKTRVLLTATEEVRLGRREKELPTGSQVAEVVTERDKNDAKVVDFLTPADGVILLDSSNLTFDETVDSLVKTIQETEVSNG
ncbi:MAG: (d)CMP kinase [Microbacteriaceae bacterium]|nr:(d)CMP kinase [Microbacteriaceae bacterium]